LQTMYAMHVWLCVINYPIKLSNIEQLSSCVKRQSTKSISNLVTSADKEILTIESI